MQLCLFSLPSVRRLEPLSHTHELEVFLRIKHTINTPIVYRLIPPASQLVFPPCPFASAPRSFNTSMSETLLLNGANFFEIAPPKLVPLVAILQSSQLVPYARDSFLDESVIQLRVHANTYYKRKKPVFPNGVLVHLYTCTLVHLYTCTPSKKRIFSKFFI